MHRFSAVALAGIGAALAGSCKAQNETEPPAGTWDGWADLKASESLEWTSCYGGGFKCAKLTVPYDWLNPEKKASPSVDLAIVLLPATVDEDDDAFGGTILTNPGGPGVPGVDNLIQNGAEMQRIADGKDKKFAVLGFDPRGIGQTMPPADCWHDRLSRIFWDREERVLGNPIEDDKSLALALARAEALVQRCEDASADADYDIKNYMSTSSVVRDMVHIVDKLDEASSSKKRRARSTDDDDEDGDKPRILYWGFSYGTIIGQYLASMFPGRVDKLLLEAVADVNDYSEGDGPEIYQWMFDSCYAAGQEACPLVTSGDSSGDDVKARFEAWLDELDKAPGVYVDGTNVYTVTRHDVMGIVFQVGAYGPVLLLQQIFGGIAMMMAGDFSVFFELVVVPGANYDCALEDVPEQYTWSYEAVRAIGCGDSVNSNQSFAEVKANIEELQEQSPEFAPFWAPIPIPCAKWTYEPEYKFTGPWESPEADADGVEGKPLHPILWLSSELDPATPLENAHRMAKSHPGSVVLAMDNVGHGTLGLPSECRDKHVRAYWQTGKMPPKDTVCESECQAFVECELPETLANSTVTAVMKRGLRAA